MSTEPEIGAARERRELDPIETVGRGRLDDLELFAHVAVAAEQHRGARADGVVERRDRDLRELDVVDPESLCRPRRP